MPRKNATGIRQLKQGLYEIRIKRINPKTGLPKEVKRHVKGTWDDACAEKVKILDELTEPTAERQRLKHYAPSWLATRLPRLKPSTAKKYAEALDLHILPALGEYWLDKLTHTDVAKYIAEKSKYLAGWTVTNQLRLLRVIARDAAADGLSGDFCARVKPPPCREYDEDDPNALTAEELGAVIGAIPEAWKPVFLLIVTTGLRWGEASGLKWDDLDELRGEIRVRRTNWLGTPVEPKTKKSKRKVPLLPEVAEELRAHRTRLLRTQNPGLAEGWVFPTPLGELHRGTPLLRVLARARSKAGVKVKVNVHGLRRTFNNLARRDTSREVLKAITGHTTDAMVDHYSVVSLEEKRAAAAGVLRRALSSEVDNQVDNSVTPGA